MVLVRLLAELKGGEPDEAKERRALKFIAVTFFALAAYVTVEGVRDLVSGESPDTSPVGIALTGASIVIMPLLAAAKRRVGLALGGDPLILADAAETPGIVQRRAEREFELGVDIGATPGSVNCERGVEGSA